MVPTKSNINTESRNAITVETLVELGDFTSNNETNRENDNPDLNHSTSKPPSCFENALFLNEKTPIQPPLKQKSRENSWHIENRNEDEATSSLRKNNNVVDRVNEEGGHRNNKNNNQHQNKKSRQSRGKNKNSTVLTLRSKITRKMRRNSCTAGSSRNSLDDHEKALNEDITDFHSMEQQKTVVRKRLKFYATMLFSMALTATALALVDTQMTIKRENQQQFLNNARVNETFTKITALKYKEVKEKIFTYKVIGITMKSLVSLISVATCVALYCYYKNLFYFKIIRFFYPKEMSFLRATPLVKKLIIECIICILHVPPYLDYVVKIPNQVQVLVFLRLYLLGRYLKEKHELMNSQSTRFLASVTKTELTSMFLFKTFFMQYPFQMILLAYIILLFIGGYGVWLIEERYTYLDTVWMLIITMTTVGFGDLTPKTMFGRFAVGITAIVGIFLMALFISLVNEALMLQRREKRILAYVENQDSTRRRKVSALNAIGMWYKYQSHLKKHFGTKDTEVLLGRGIRAQAKKDIVSIVKAKLFETRMYRTVNEWRKVKNERGGHGFFAQEFMIEDMKNMMTDLTSKMNEFDEKMDGIIGDVQAIKHIDNRRNSRNSKVSKSFSPYDIYAENDILDDERGRVRNYSNDMSNGIVTYTQNENDLQNYPSPSSNRNSTKGLREFLSDRNKPSSKLRKSELQMAFKLLKNQAKIMNNALDDIYYKTRQDICDMENIISSLVVSSDVEENTVDYVPQRDYSIENQNV